MTKKRLAEAINSPFAWAGIATAIWIVVAFCVGWNAKLVDGKTFGSLQANEWGDYLAGVFAPVAFFWFAAAVWLQARELRAQREELALTRQEFVLNRGVLEAQGAEIREQAAALRAQAEVMAEEQMQRRDAENEANVKAAMGAIGTLVMEIQKAEGTLNSTFRDPDDRSQRLAVLQATFTKQLKLGRFKNSKNLLRGVLQVTGQAMPWIGTLQPAAFWRLEAGRVQQLHKEIQSYIDLADAKQPSDEGAEGA